jgi:SAM-dependent methyltransferase
MAVVDHWPRHARQWALVGPPLRPCAEDLAVVAPYVASARRGAVVLGVTPELVALPWRCPVVAVDRDREVIAALHAGAGAVAADWRALPVATSSVDVVVGDGCLSFFAVADYPVVARELARVLVPGGRAVLRLFAASEPRAPLAAIDPAACASFDALKWRIAMALGEAVPVTAIKAAFDARFADRAALAAHTGWRRDVIDAIDVYAGSPAIYTFPTLSRAAAAVAPALAVVSVHAPSYDACYPTVVLHSG